MGCLGVHFALDLRTVRKLKSFKSEDDRLEFLQEGIEERYFTDQGQWLAETDKAWDAIHRALTDGALEWDNGTYPLNHVILGGEVLYTGEDYIMSLKTRPQVRDVAAGLKKVRKAEFEKAYFQINPSGYRFPVSDQDFEYTWSWFLPLRGFYIRAAEADRFVLFTADQ